MSPAAGDVAKLRADTGAGMMDCKRALTETDGDFQAATDLLRTWGLAGVEKRAGRAASDGMVGYYMHQLDPDLPPKVGVLVELNCETDFVAKTSEFKQLARDIAMHIAAMAPQWPVRSDVPEDFLDREKKILLESDAVKGKKPEIVEKIIEGKLVSIFSGIGGVLVDQPFLRDDSGKKTVGDLIAEYAAQVKENIVVSRFVRFKVGE
ncbi:MAG: translation elongation factor Ts [Actinomycetota bacterium]